MYCKPVGEGEERNTTCRTRALALGIRISRRALVSSGLHKKGGGSQSAVATEKHSHKRRSRRRRDEPGLRGRAHAGKSAAGQLVSPSSSRKCSSFHCKFGQRGQAGQGWQKAVCMLYENKVCI